MNRIIAKSLAQSLINLDFITRAAGCVQEITLPLKGGKSKKLPAATEVYTAPNVCNREETYKDLIPNSRETGILYFEDLGSKIVDKSSRREKWKGSLKLVCWLQVGNRNIDVSSLPIWDTNTQYNTGDKVAHNGRAWKAIAEPEPDPAKAPDTDTGQWIEIFKVCEEDVQDLDAILCEVKALINDDIATSDKVLGGKIRVVQEYPKRPSPFERYDYDEKETQYLIYPYDYFSLKVEYWVYMVANCC